MDSTETDLLPTVLDVFELHGVGAPHLVLLLKVQLATLLIALVEVLSISVCVVIMQAVPPPLDCCPHALVRSMAALGDYHKARLPPPTSVAGKVESWKAMALLSPLIVGLTEAAPLLRMLPVRLAPINSQDAPISPGETAPAGLR